MIDQSRLARGLGEPPEPIVTGNSPADEIVVEPHSLADDALTTLSLQDVLRALGLD